MTTVVTSPPDAGLARIGELLIAARGARALTAAVALGVFDALADGPASAGALAVRLGADARATRILLDALVALDLLARSAGRYEHTPLSARYLVSGAPASLAENLRYQDLLAPAWAGLPQVIRTGKPQASLEELLGGAPDFARSYIRGMAEIARRPARELARQLELSPLRAMLDVGGGPGAYAEAFLEAAPAATAVLLDLPPTLQIAREFLAESPARPRIDLRAGNYHQADFGREAFDLVLMSHITHDEGEAANAALVAKALAALRPGGRLVIHDFMLDTDRTTPLFGALFSLHMLVYTQQGRTYSADEYACWLRGAGFRDLRRLEVCPRSPNATQALVGSKP